MDRQHILAIKALIVDFLSGYPSLMNAGETTVDAYVRPVMAYSLEAVARAIGRYSRGEVPGQNLSFPPTAVEFYAEATKHEQIAQRRDKAAADLPPAPPGCKRLPDGTLIVPVGVEFDGWDETYLPDGTTTDHGHGRIHLGGLTRREARVIDELGGMAPSGKSFALLSLSEKRAEIARYLPTPVAA